MKPLILILTAWWPLISVDAFNVVVLSPRTATGCSGILSGRWTTSTTTTMTTSTCLFSATRGRPSSSSRGSSSRSNGDGREDDASGSGGRRRVGRRGGGGVAGGGGGPTSGDGIGDDMSGRRRRRSRRSDMNTNFGSSTIYGGGGSQQYSSGPNSMNGRSMNAQRSGTGSRGGSSSYLGQNRKGADYDYSGGNLRFGTGKYQQRVNDGYTGGVNLSTDGRSMQHDVYASGRNVGSRFYDRLHGVYDDYDVMGIYNEDDGFDMMLDDDRMMYDDYDMLMMDGNNDYYDDLYYRRTPGGSGDRDRGGGVFRDDYYERAGRGGPRAYSNSRNGGYTTNGRSHQYNSRLDELRRYQDGFYYGDDSYFAQRGGLGDVPPPQHGGGSAGLLRDMFD
jgi:hypothetical protein